MCIKELAVEPTLSRFNPRAQLLHTFGAHDVPPLIRLNIISVNHLGECDKCGSRLRHITCTENTKHDDGSRPPLIILWLEVAVGWLIYQR